MNILSFISRALLAALIFIAFPACSSSAGKSSDTIIAADTESPQLQGVEFSADSAFSYVARQVEFGPRVPNTAAHSLTSEWLASELRRHGADVTLQKADLKAFDGTTLHATNIFGQFNPQASDRLLLLAHWDCRPWADADPDPAKRKMPVDGANDGASGVGVLLEIARQLSLNPTDKGIDILFVDAEDWGDEGDEDSWALGTRHFVENPPVKGYHPAAAILLDMVGGKDATFYREYFSQQSAPALNDKIWSLAADFAPEGMFVNRIGTAVTDDHIQLIQAGIPAIDIIEYHPEKQCFNPNWHTTSDNMEAISPAALGAVGKIVMALIRQ